MEPVTGFSPRLRAGFVEPDIPSCQAASGLIAVAEPDAQTVRRPSRLSVVLHVNLVGVSRHAIDLRGPFEVATRLGPSFCVDRDGGRLHMHPGAVVDVVEGNLRGGCVWLEPGVEAEAGSARVGHDPTTTCDEILALGRRWAPRTAVNVAVGAGENDLVSGFEGQVHGIDRDRPGPRTQCPPLLIDGQRGQWWASCRIGNREHLIRSKGIDAEGETSEGDLSDLR